jgi:flagellar protein FliJ
MNVRFHLRVLVIGAWSLVICDRTNLITNANTMFRFRLETLLRLRLAERDQRRAELAKAIRAEELIRSQQRSLAQQQLQALEHARQLKSPGAADVDALLRTHRYELVLAAQQRQLAAQLAQVEAESERRRQILVEADRQVRVLEKLRERQAAAHRQNAERLQTKQLDEVAIVGYVRRKEAPT